MYIYYICTSCPEKNVRCAPCAEEGCGKMYAVYIVYIYYMYKLYVQVHSAYPVLRYALRAYLNYDTLRVGWRGKGEKRKKEKKEKIFTS